MTMGQYQKSFQINLKHLTRQWLRLQAWFFTIQLAQEVPFGMLQYHRAFLMDLPVSSFVCHSSLLTAKSVDFVVGT